MDLCNYCKYLSNIPVFTMCEVFSNDTTKSFLVFHFNFTGLQPLS